MNRLIVISFLFITFFSCKYDKLDVVDDPAGYPQEIKDIIVTKCATAGCHNDQSYLASAELNLSTWDKLFEGGSGGAAVIPYRPDYSLLLYFTNIDSSEGLILLPTMPFNGTPLSKQEYLTLKNWIINGAPDRNGFVKFSDVPERLKVYISNQGVDEMEVLDVKSNLIMRSIHIGTSDNTEVPHLVKVSPDNKFWYTIFFVGNVLQKFRTSDNALVGNIDIGPGSWNTMAISSDGKRGYAVDMTPQGKVAVVDLENLTLLSTIDQLDYPHGSALSKNNDTLYVTAQTGNFIYKIPLANTSDFEKILIDDVDTVISTVSSIDGHEIAFSTDYSKYYITCQSSNDVRVMRTSDDKLLKKIPTPKFPVEMAFSNTKPYLFITCLSTENPGSSIVGQVYVIDTNTDDVIKSINTGHQPHGIAVVDEYNRVYVANRNASHGGPAGHHSSNTGRNGYLTAIDLNTLELITDYKTEVLVDPYSLSNTH